MSGYRTIHRVKQDDFPLISSSSSDKEQPSSLSSSSVDSPKPQPQPIWAVTFSQCNQSRPKQTQISSSLSSNNNPSPLRLLTSSADGLLRAFTITNPSDKDRKELNASALKMKLTHVLLPSSTMAYPPKEEERMITLGSGAISTIRNYVAEDPNAGGEVTCSLRLNGHVSIWLREEQPLYYIENGGKNEISSPVIPVPVRPDHQFYVEDAAGTTMVLLPPKITGHTKDGVTMLLGCLDGSIAFLSTGIAIPNPAATSSNSTSSSNLPPAAGTVLDKIGSNNAVPTGIALHPTKAYIFAVGRKNGVVDVYGPSQKHHSFKNKGPSRGAEGLFRRMHHLNHHAGSIVRALAYTPDDGALLITGSDVGDIYIHDTSSSIHNQTIRMVAAIHDAHKGYVLSMKALDSKRFITSGADATVKVWDVAKPNSGASHTFDTGHIGLIWGVCCSVNETNLNSNDGIKCVSAGDDGLLQFYACEE